MTPYNYYLIYHDFIHLLIAIPIAYIFYKWYGKKAVLVVFLATFLIDIDHLFDLLLAGVNDIPARLINGNIFEGVHNKYLIFHSFELVAILLVVGRYLQKYRWLFFPLAVAIFYHLTVDIVSYFEKGLMPWEYSWIFNLLR